MNDQQVEAASQAKGLNAPRVTLQDLQANIADVEYVKYVSKSGQVLRWAILTTRNGFAVTGRPSVAVSPANDTAEIGESVARDNAINELWPLMGYALKEKQAATPPTYQERVRKELADRTGEVDRLSAFLDTPGFKDLAADEQHRMREQREILVDLVNVLARRIAAFTS